MPIVPPLQINRDQKISISVKNEDQCFHNLLVLSIQGWDSQLANSVWTSVVLTSSGVAAKAAKKSSA